jgi:hypothetical protein
VRSILASIQELVLPDQVAVPKAHETFAADGQLADQELQAAVTKIGARVAEVLAKLLG